MRHSRRRFLFRWIRALVVCAAFAPQATFAEAPAKKVLVFVGMPGAGKTTAAKRLAARLGAPHWTSGDVIRKTIAERGLPYTAENDRAVAEEFGHRPGEIGRRIAAEVASAPGSVAIIEGFRTPADVIELRKTFPDATVVAVQVGAGRRYQRMLARGRAGEDNEAYLRDRDRAELRRGVGKVMRAATVRVRPRGNDLAALDRSLDRVLRLAGIPASAP